MNIQGCFPLGMDWFDLLAKQGLSTVFSHSAVQKHQFFGTQPSLWSNSHICTLLTGKSIALTTWTFVGKVISLLFNTLLKFVIAFLLSKHLLISLLLVWLQSPSPVILEPKKRKSVIAPTFPPLFSSLLKGL